MRVLLLATALDARTHLDGTRLAIKELAAASSLAGLRPLVLVRPGILAPEGCEAIGVVPELGMAGLIAACVRARPDLVHAVFAPRRRTGVVLAGLRRMLRIPLVQTIASVPRSLSWPTLVGDIVVATSQWMDGILSRRGWTEARRAFVPMPFRSPTHVDPAAVDLPAHFLHVGDWEFGGGPDDVIEAFSEISPPIGLVPHLALAGRTKTRASKRRELQVRARIDASPSLRGRVHVLGELPSLLPNLARARCVLLPARDTEAKLDHPRALLEAIALGTRIVVGSAPSLSELVVADSIGEVATDVPSLRRAMERSFDPPAARLEETLSVIDPRRPQVVAAAYAEIYARAVAVRSRRGD